MIMADDTGKTEWRRDFENDLPDTSIQLSDVLEIPTEGFVIAGHGGESVAGEWKEGLLLLKVDQSGKILWKNIYSSEDVNVVHTRTKVVLTSEGGFAMAGAIQHWPREASWLVITDNTGTIVWNRAYLGPMDDDVAKDIVSTGDGGYAIIGCTNSLGAGKTDILLVKSNENGTEEWSRSYGGSGDDIASALIQTSDGGFAFIGSTTLIRVRQWEEPGPLRFITQTREETWEQTVPWLVKTDPYGTVLWNQTFEELGGDKFTHLLQTPDGGYAITTDSSMFKVIMDRVVTWNWYSGEYGDIKDITLASDGGIVLVTSRGIWFNQIEVSLIKISRGGIFQWSRSETIKDDDNHLETTLIKSNDNGFSLIVSGITEITGENVNQSAFLKKTDEFGFEIWKNSFGAEFNADQALNLIQMTDGRYFLLGQAHSYEAGWYGVTVTDEEYQGIIVDENGVFKSSLSLIEHGEEISDAATSIHGGIAMAGTAISFSKEKGMSFDFMLVKTDENGTMTWRQSYGKTGGESNSWEVSTNIQRAHAQDQLIQDLFGLPITVLQVFIFVIMFLVPIFIGPILTLFPLWIGIIGVVYIFKTGKKTRAPIDFQPSTKIIICPSCRFANKTGSTSCSHCNHDFTTFTKQTVPQDNGSASKTTWGKKDLALITILSSPVFLLVILGYIKGAERILQGFTEYQPTIVLLSFITISFMILLTGFMLGVVIMSKTRIKENGSLTFGRLKTALGQIKRQS
jgi:hypothetical protein